MELQAKLEEDTKAEEMRQAEALQALKSEVQRLRYLQKNDMQEQRGAGAAASRSAAEIAR